MRGKQAASAANRRGAAADRERIEHLEHQVTKLTAERDDWHSRHDALQGWYEAQAKALTADRDEAVSPALRTAEAVILDLQAEVAHLEKARSNMELKWIKFLRSSGMSLSAAMNIIEGRLPGELAREYAGTEDEYQRRIRLAAVREGRGGVDSIHGINDRRTILWETLGGGEHGDQPEQA